MTATLVELVDGRIVSRDAQEWLHETAARQILSYPLEKRRAHLADIEARRGKEAADALKATMTALHAGRQT